MLFTILVSGFVASAVAAYQADLFSREGRWRWRNSRFMHCGHCGERLKFTEINHVHGPNFIEYPHAKKDADRLAMKQAAAMEKSRRRSQHKRDKRGRFR